MTRPNLMIHVGLVASIVAVLAYAGATGIAEQARAREQLSSIRAQIVGTWRLDSLYEENAGGEDIAQFGPAPKGRFMADAHGNFA